VPAAVHIQRAAPHERAGRSRVGELGGTWLGTRREAWRLHEQIWHAACGNRDDTANMQRTSRYNASSPAGAGKRQRYAPTGRLSNDAR